MDDISFKVKEALGGLYDDSVDIYINGENLTKTLKSYELPFAIKEGRSDIAGQYMGIGSKKLIERVSKPTQQGIIYACECGEEGCWPMVISVSEDENTVSWFDFRQPHRGIESKASHWDYSKFPGFIFDKKKYREALVALARDAEKISDRHTPR